MMVQADIQLQDKFKQDQPTNTKHWADEEAAAQHELPINWVCVGVGGELKEERSDHSGSW